ncbi:MAG: heavy metal-binding domain-containing protein [Candidatus Kapabacteria bacterium]|nr:heavy metal-binding domain-containing protein [Candidatus Kapabacteria bacterium]
MYESFREEARKIGAQAVLRVQFGSTNVGYFSYLWAVGTAVKYK